MTDTYNTLYMEPLSNEERWQSITNINAMKHAFSESDDHGKAYRICLNYAAGIREMLDNGIGLRLHGEVGTGKTFFASCIGSYIRQAGYNPEWIDCKNFIAQMADWKTRNDDYIDRILCSPILIIDDLDTKKLNALELSCLFRLINAREDRLNIITTNMTPSAITNNESADMDERRALSRIQAMCPIAIVLTGKDRRADVAASKRELAQKILKGGGE